MEELKNLLKITFSQKLKTFLLKFKFGSRLLTEGPIRILGNMPMFKLPGSSKIILGSKVVLNSHSKNSNTALTFNCTLVCGLTGVIQIGKTTMLNGVSVTSFRMVTIGDSCQIGSSTLISDTDFTQYFLIFGSGKV